MYIYICICMCVYIYVYISIWSFIDIQIPYNNLIGNLKNVDLAYKLSLGAKGLVTMRETHSGSGFLLGLMIPSGLYLGSEYGDLYL